MHCCRPLAFLCRGTEKSASTARASPGCSVAVSATAASASPTPWSPASHTCSRWAPQFPSNA